MLLQRLPVFRLCMSAQVCVARVLWVNCQVFLLALPLAGYAEVEPFDEAAGQQEGQGGGDTQPLLAGRHSAELRGEQGEQAAGDAVASGAAEAADADEFGSDVYADLAASQQQQQQAPVESTAQPQAVPTVPPFANGPAGAASALDDGDDDLYGGLGLGLGPTIPQVDGAADMSPRRRRSGGADPEERWALGSEDDVEGARRGGGVGQRCTPACTQRPQIELPSSLPACLPCSAFHPFSPSSFSAGADRRPTEERSSRRRRHKDRSSEKSEKRHKHKDSR
jgi:hypothetical protein